MLIAFTGAQSTGKSTLLKECKKLNLFNGYTFITEVTRRIKRTHKVDINNEAANYDQTQLLIEQDHAKNAQFKNAILDRCFMDGFIYTKYFYNCGKVSQNIMDMMEASYQHYFGNYDVVFYTDPNIPLVDDGERSVDIEFRNKIVELFEEEVDIMQGFAGVKIVRLTGSVKDRMHIIEQHVELQNANFTI